ncbi:MAG: antitoxin family protein [Roseiflexaceae bacterium]|nr:antitoxin family protein [Roseiflexaceae bacterium]
MLSTIRAVVRNGKIELLEPISLTEGVQVLVTVLTDEDQSFWQAASSSTLERVWDNDEDDVYAELLPR